MTCGTPAAKSARAANPTPGMPRFSPKRLCGIPWGDPRAVTDKGRSGRREDGDGRRAGAGPGPGVPGGVQPGVGQDGPCPDPGAPVTLHSVLRGIRSAADAEHARQLEGGPGRPLGGRPARAGPCSHRGHARPAGPAAAVAAQRLLPDRQGAARHRARVRAAGDGPGGPGRPAVFYLPQPVPQQFTDQRLTLFSENFTADCVWIQGNNAIREVRSPPKSAE